MCRGPRSAGAGRKDPRSNPRRDALRRTHLSGEGLPGESWGLRLVRPGLLCRAAGRIIRGQRGHGREGRQAGGRRGAPGWPPGGLAQKRRGDPASPAALSPAGSAPVPTPRARRRRRRLRSRQPSRQAGRQAGGEVAARRQQQPGEAAQHRAEPAGVKLTSALPSFASPPPQALPPPLPTPRSRWGKGAGRPKAMGRGRRGVGGGGGGEREKSPTRKG